MRMKWVGAALFAAAAAVSGCGDDEKKDGGVVDMVAPGDFAAPVVRDMAMTNDGGDGGGTNDAGAGDSGVRDGGTGG